MKKTFTLFAIVAAFSLSAAPAFADKGGHNHQKNWKNHHHHNHHYGHHHKPYKNGISISINSGWPSYYHHYYPSYTVVKPIYITQPVYVQPVVEQVIFASNVPGYQNDYGQYCREYNALIFVGGQKQSGYGTACYQPDGSWKVVN